MASVRKQLTRQDWIVAAKKVFIASGIEEVKVDRLARRLKISRGSFYWHFKSRKELLDALLQEWEAFNRMEMEQIHKRAAGGTPAVADVVAVCLREDPAFPSFGIAVRIWARKSPRVAEIVRAVDDAWIELFQAHFRLDGRSELESYARAVAAYYHPIGYHLLGRPRKLEDRLLTAPIFHEIFTGRAADPALELALRGVRGEAEKPAKRRRGAA